MLAISWWRHWLVTEQTLVILQHWPVTEAMLDALTGHGTDSGPWCQRQDWSQNRLTELVVHLRLSFHFSPLNLRSDVSDMRCLDKFARCNDNVCWSHFSILCSLNPCPVWHSIKVFQCRQAVWYNGWGNVNVRWTGCACHGLSLGLLFLSQTGWKKIPSLKPPTGLD